MSPGQIYKRLLGYAWHYWPVFMLAVLGMAVVATTEAGLAWIMKPMLDGTFVKKDPVIIKWLPFGLLLIVIIRGLAGFISSYGMAHVGRNIIRDMRRQMFSQFMHLPTDYYDRNSSGQLTSKIIYDVEKVAQAATKAVTIVVRDTFTIIGLMFMMFYTSWKLAMVFLFLAPVITLLVVAVSKRFRRISKRIQASMGNVTQKSQETTEGHRVIKMFGGEDYEEKHFSRINENNRQQNMKLMATKAVSVPVSQLLGACGLAVILYFATSPEMLDALTVGTFVAFLTASMLLLAPMKRLTMVQATVQQGIAAAQSVFQLLDESTERNTGTKEAKRAKGHIEFKNVTFSYDSAEDKEKGKAKGVVLRNINFTAEAGETVALVGRSGSGKSTLASLLPRLYDVTEGEILLDGIPVQELTLENLREQIALVSQDITLFNDTITKNIAYGALAEMNEEDIIRAAEAAHALEFIRELPEGFDTVVGDKGVLLSGGQRQRIAIARALLKNAPLLILDEATSALDTESERYIQEALASLMKHCTTLVIAHRLSTVEDADKILVIHDGCIIESGNHKELLAANGKYAALYKVQFTDDPEKSD
ncbi:MAG: lipid A export permease/ATP-binding protein MsbA [Gammaproteobacteria bacterium]|nr:lipid A export permease/ATP-binding protein MsbA [Gammaproteobacteria bacterium]